jgi:DNA-binding MarR family transcriptional regulator
MGLRAAYLLMHRQTNSFLAPFGMTADQFVLLALLADKDGVTQQELTQRASSDPNTIRAMLVRMESNGVVIRDQHPTDGRARKITLTRRGHQIYSKLSVKIKPLQDALLSPFQIKDANKFITFLNRISESMTQWERGHQTMKVKQVI